MKRFLLAAVAVAALGATLIGPAQAAPNPTTTSSTTVPAGPAKAAGPVTPDGGPAIDDLGSCVRASGRLLVLFLIDESGSLSVTDPQALRVDAARSALSTLVKLGNGGAVGPQVQVAVAAFANAYQPVQDWTPADLVHEGQIDQSLEGFRTRNRGTDTDFVTAFTGARLALAQQSTVVTANGGSPPCKAILLFTDGGFDLAVRTPAQASTIGLTKPYAPGIAITSIAAKQKVEALGRAAMCNPNGIADGVRGDGITLISVVLSGSLSAHTQLFLAAATAGMADKYPCGSPTQRPPGDYLAATNVGDLVARFDEVATRLDGGVALPGSDEIQVCAKTVCPAGTRNFTLDRTLGRVHLLALPPKGPAELHLTGPKGSVVLRVPGVATVGGVRVVTHQVAGRGLSIDLDRPADDTAWAGTWSATLVDPTATAAVPGGFLEIFVFSEIGIQLGRVSLVRDTPTTLTTSLVVPKGVSVKQLIVSAKVTIRFDNLVTGRSETVDLHGPPTGPYTAAYTPPKGITANAVVGTAIMKASTVGGAVLISQSAARTFLVRRPAGSIQFAPASMQMPSITGKGSASGVLFITGGNKPGCVWFGPNEPPGIAPPGATPLGVTINGKAAPGHANCLPVAANQQLQVTVRVRPKGRSTGTVRANLAVFEQVTGAQPSLTMVPYGFSLAAGVDQARRLLVAFLLGVGGLALPMLLLLVINTISARFQDLDAILGTVLPVSVRNGRIVRKDHGQLAPVSLNPEDFGPLAESDSTRRFRFGGIEFRARASRNPFGATHAMAAPEGGAEKLKGREGSRVELDPGLSGSWVFLLDADMTARAGQGTAEGALIAFVATGDIGAQTTRMVDDIEHRLPGVAATLARLVREGARKADPKPRLPDEPMADTDETASPDAAQSSDDAPPDGAAPPDGSEGDAHSDAPTDDPAAAAEPAAPMPVGFGGATPAGAPAVPVAGDDTTSSDTAQVDGPPAGAGDGDGDGDDDGGGDDGGGDDGGGGEAPPVGFGGIKPGD